MRTFIGLCLMLILIGCARTPEEAAAYRQLGAQILTAQPDYGQSNSSPCAFNPANNSYQQCFHFNALGQCLHYGGICQP